MRCVLKSTIFICLSTLPQGGAPGRVDGWQIMPISSWEISQESCKAFSKKNVKMSPKGRPPTCSAPGSPCCRLQNWFNPCLGSGGEGLLPKVLRGGMDPPTSGSGRALACGHQQPPCLTKQKASMGKIQREGTERISGEVRWWAGGDMKRHQEGPARIEIPPGGNRLLSMSWLWWGPEATPSMRGVCSRCHILKRGHLWRSHAHPLASLVGGRPLMWVSCHWEHAIQRDWAP